MKKLKKLALWLMMMVLVFSLSACGEKEDEDSKSDRKDRVEESNDKDDDKESKDDADDKKSEDDKEESESKEEDGETKAKDEEPDASKEDSDKDSEETDAVDAEFLLNKLYEIANNNNTMTQTTMNMELEMSISMNGESMNIDMVSVGENLIQLNPYEAYSYTEMTMKMAGQQETMISESYILTEDGNLVSYAYDGSTDAWTKMDTGMSEAELMEQASANFDWIKEKPLSDFNVDTQLHNINGREAYKVEFTLTGEEMNKSLNGMAGIKDMLEESGMGDLFDMSSLSVPAVYYIDAETYYIIQMEMDMQGLDEMMNNMISSLLGADAATAGYEIGFSIGKCHVVYSDISYDPVEVPALPAEARETTDVINIEDLEVDLGTTEEDWGTNAVQPEDGVYTIEESGAVAKVTCPEGWTVVYSAYDSIDIENEETWQEAEFVMYMDVTREDFVAYVEEMIVPELQQYEGVYVSHGAGPQIGDYETMEVLGDGLNFYFAWAPAGEGWIMVTVSEFNGVSLEDALPPILDLIDLNNVL